MLQEGDIINVDVSTILDGYFSDSSRMFCIGGVSPEKQRLVDVTKECVEKGLAQVKPWGFLGDMSQAVYDHAHANGYSVVREIGGHGVGWSFMRIPGWDISEKQAPACSWFRYDLYIEPMINMGGPEIFVDDSDGWTVYTEDGKPSRPVGDHGSGYRRGHGSPGLLK